MFPLNKLPTDLIETIIRIRLDKIGAAAIKIQKYFRSKVEQKNALIRIISDQDYNFEYNYIFTILKMFGRVKWICPQEIKTAIRVSVDCYGHYNKRQSLTVQYARIEELVHETCLFERLY